jgi:hypothetical protein
MSSDLTSKEQKLVDIEKVIRTYGTTEMVNATIDKLRKSNTWDDFIKEYPYGKAIIPHSIKNVIIKHDYYSELTPTPTPTPTFEERRPKDTDVIVGTKPNYHYDDNGVNLLFKDHHSNPLNLHGGKRKTHRKKKSKNSRKNKSRKTHLKSNRRR